MPPDLTLDLPDSVKAELDAMRQTPSVSKALETFALTLKTRRDKAVQDRVNSGLEDVWTRCEDYYHGADDAGQTTGISRARWIKPPTMEGPLRRNVPPAQQEVRSFAFVRLTARYVDAGSAKAVEILLPPDDKAFTMRPTPRPELLDALEKAHQIVANGQSLERDPRPEEMPLPDPGQPAPAPSQLPGVPLTPRDLAEEKRREADKRAKAAELRIFDWMVEGKFTREMRGVLHDAPKLGVGVLKGPYPERRKARVVSKEGDQVTLIVQDKVAPAFKRINPWNFFPDPACGERIENGGYVWERDFLSERMLSDLKDQPGYLGAAIDQVIEEGPGKRKQEDNPSIPTVSEDSYPIWYFHGFLSKEERDTLNQGFGRDERDPLRFSQKDEPLYCVVSLVNDTVIHAVTGPSETGRLPYHAVPWQPRAGSWAGVGVAEQVFVPQEMVNGATRAMLDNAGKSAGTIMAIDRSLLEPADGNWIMARDKTFYTKNESITDDVRKGITTFEIPNRTPQLMTIIEYAFRLAEESSSIPLITQGQSGKTTPETFGAAQLQNSNANQLLRNIAVSVDDCITEPVVEELHEWLLLDPDVPLDEKDDFQIQAHGSLALVERAIQDQVMVQIAPMVLNPAFGVDPKRWMAEMLKTKRMRPADLQFSDEEQRRLDETPPPPAPMVQAAQIRGQIDLQKAKMELDRDTAYVQAETERTRTMAAGKERQMQLDYLIELAKFAHEKNLSLEDAKVELAVTALKLRTQKDLSLMEGKSGPPVITPPSEPAQRAKSGHAFEQ